MSGDEVRVDPDDLIRKAGQLDGIDWGGDESQTTPVVPPDATTTAHTAVDNLNANAKTLGDYQKYGIAQGRRLAETLRSVAAAYAAVDRNAMDNINKTVPGEIPAPPSPVTPAQNSIAAPTPPGGLPTQKGMTEEYLDVESAQAQLLAGDRGGSLHGAATRWAHDSATLVSAAEAFEIADVNWEGEAADAAYRQFADYRGFLLELSGAWGRLASEAEKIAGAHASTLGEHTTVFEQYEQLKAQLPAAVAGGGGAARVVQNKMAELQHESETVRDGYMRTAQPDEVRPPVPAQNTGTPPAPVLGNGDPRQPAGVQRGGGTGGSSGGGGGAPTQQGGEGAGAAAKNALPSAPSPMSASQQAGQAAQQAGGSPDGGSPGGGSPGGGQPGGGSPGGGMPGRLPGTGAPGRGAGSPKLPKEPTLKPAALRGGGVGSGVSGGGGGVPASPLQPAVGAETVAPVPNKVTGAPGVAAGAAPGGGGAMGGGGMGGMAPMGHGAQGGSSEKKRNPQLSQDEELYTEDRPWTEAVVGNRARRRGAPDDKKEL